MKHTLKLTWIGCSSKQLCLQILTEVRELKLTTLDDWHNVTYKQVASFYGSNLLHKFGGLMPLLQKIYPNHIWDKRLKNKWGKSQWRVSQIVKSYLQSICLKAQSEGIALDYQHPELVFPTSQHKMELDIFVPSLSLAFEYQGEQHFDPHYLFGATQNIKERDSEKRIACERIGIQLVEIPFWWDRSQVESCVARAVQTRVGEMEFGKPAGSKECNSTDPT
jgi:hypothetical protein